MKNKITLRERIAWTLYKLKLVKLLGLCWTKLVMWYVHPDIHSFHELWTDCKHDPNCFWKNQEIDICYCGLYKKDFIE